MSRKTWQRFERQTLRLLGTHLQAKHAEGGSKCTLAGCQIDAFGVFERVALVFESKSSQSRQSINVNKTLDQLAGRKNAIVRALRNRYGKQIKYVRFIVVVHNASDISSLARKRTKPKDIYIWTPKYFEGVKSLAKTLNQRALPYILRELGINDLAAALGYKRELLKFPALRTVLPGGKPTLGLFSFFAPARALLELGFVARLEASQPKAYQRLLNGARLRDIGKYIQAEGGFKNSVVISLPKTTGFVRKAIAKNKSTVAEVGILKIPRIPASLWIIDGQHRASTATPTQTKNC